MKCGILFLDGKMGVGHPSSLSTNKKYHQPKMLKKLAALLLLLLFCTPLLFVSLQLCARAFLSALLCTRAFISFPPFLPQSLSSIPWLLDCGLHSRHQCWENRLEFFGTLHGTNFQDCILVLFCFVSFFLSLLALQFSALWSAYLLVPDLLISSAERLAFRRFFFPGTSFFAFSSPVLITAYVTQKLAGGFLFCIAVHTRSSFLIFFG